MAALTRRLFPTLAAAMVCWACADSDDALGLHGDGGLNGSEGGESDGGSADCDDCGEGGEDEGAEGSSAEEGAEGSVEGNEGAEGLEGTEGSAEGLEGAQPCVLDVDCGPGFTCERGQCVDIPDSDGGAEGLEGAEGQEGAPEGGEGSAEGVEGGGEDGGQPADDAGVADAGFPGDGGVNDPCRQYTAAVCTRCGQDSGKCEEAKFLDVVFGDCVKLLRDYETAPTCNLNCPVKCAGTGAGPQVCGYDDKCHIDCGHCQGLEVCAFNGTQCCSPNCANKACGPDGCGGSCGDCGGEGFCIAAACHTTPCALDVQCSGGFCREGFCVPKCAASTDCFEGEVCAEGICFGTECLQNADCKQGACIRGHCKNSCDSDDDCPAGAVCAAGGKCVIPECAVQADCPFAPTQDCVDRQCEFRTCGNGKNCLPGEICTSDPTYGKVCYGSQCSDTSPCLQSGTTCQLGHCMAGCTSDSGCAPSATGETRVCIEATGQCAAIQCTSDETCPFFLGLAADTGAFCDADNQCRLPSCAGTGQCPEGFACEGSACLRTTCNADYQCGVGRECVQGKCKDLGAPCAQNADCKSGERCRASQCVKSNCTVDTDCTGGLEHFCDDGVCVAGCRSLNNCCKACTCSADGFCTHPFRADAALTKATGATATAQSVAVVYRDAHASGPGDCTGEGAIYFGNCCYRAAAPPPPVMKNAGDVTILASAPGQAPAVAGILSLSTGYEGAFATPLPDSTEIRLEAAGGADILPHGFTFPGWPPAAIPINLDILAAAGIPSLDRSVNTKILWPGFTGPAKIRLAAAYTDSFTGEHRAFSLECFGQGGALVLPTALLAKMPPSGPATGGNARVEFSTIRQERISTLDTEITAQSVTTVWGEVKLQ